MWTVWVQLHLGTPGTARLFVSFLRNTLCLIYLVLYLIKFDLTAIYLYLLMFFILTGLIYLSNIEEIHLTGIHPQKFNSTSESNPLTDMVGKFNAKRQSLEADSDKNSDPHLKQSNLIQTKNSFCIENKSFCLLFYRI